MSAVAAELLVLIKREKNKKTPANCLLSIAHIPDCQDPIFSKIAVLFETCSPVRDEEVSVTVLSVCTHLTEKSRMDAFAPFIPTLRSVMDKPETPPRVAIAAANVCLNLSNGRPELLQSSTQFFVELARRRAEVAVLCSAIVDQLTGQVAGAVRS
jgi:hypothetical protein